MQTNNSGELDVIEKYVYNIRRIKYQSNTYTQKELLQEAWCIRLKCQKSYDIKYGLTYDQFERMCIYRHLLRLISASCRYPTISMEGIDKIDRTTSSQDFIDVKHLTERLSSRERMILNERYDLGLTFDEIGKKLGTSRQAVESTHSRIIRKMRSWLNV